MFEDQTFRFLHSDVFCNPTLKQPFNIVWFPEKTGLLFHVSDFN